MYGCMYTSINSQESDSQIVISHYYDNDPKYKKVAMIHSHHFRLNITDLSTFPLY